MPAHPLSRLTALRPATWWLIGLSMLFLLVWLAPQSDRLQDVEIMPLSMHVAMETFAIVVAMMVFGITWNAYAPERSGNAVILATGFLLVALLDFGHMFSFRGMPDFVTPSGPEKAIQFWLAERFVVALVLLLVALRIWQRPFVRTQTRYWFLGVSLAAAAAVFWLTLYHPDRWPRTFIEGEGLTSLKIAAEYLIALLLALAALLYARQARQGDPRATGNAYHLAAASLVSMLGELCFVLYSAVDDFFNLLGHVYKVIGYLFIYRAVFIESVREPFRRLDATKKALKRSQMMLQSILENVPVRIFWKDRDGHYLGANKRMLDDLGMKEVDELVGKDDFALYPPEQARAFRADDQQVLRTRQPKLDIEEPMRMQDGSDAWLLTNKVPMYNLDGEVNGVLGAYNDITSLRTTELHLAEANRQLRELTVNREAAREEERKRIAQDLHDELGQMLTGMRMEIGLLRMQFGDSDPRLLESLQILRGQVDDTIQVVRDVAAKLRPAVLDMGIESALEWKVQDFRRFSKLPCELTVDPGVVLNDEQATTVFRIVQESLTNIMRHAQAQQVAVRLLQRGDHCLLEIEDDGVGFPAVERHARTFGLMGMRERALVLGGELEIESVTGRGTRISVRITDCQCRRERDDQAVDRG